MTTSLRTAAALTLLAAPLSLSQVVLAQAGPGQLPGPAVDPAQTAVEAFLAAHPNTQLSVRGAGITRVYGRAFSEGAGPVQSAEAFRLSHAAMFGVQPADLLPIGPYADGTSVLPLVYDAATNSSKFTQVSYTQHLNGIPVFRADMRVLVRNEPGFPAVLVTSSLRNLGAFAAGFNARAVSPAQIDVARLERAVRKEFARTPEISGQQMVIWAGVDETPADPRLAYQFTAELGTVADPVNHKKVLYLVDAANGAILYQENLILHVDVSGTTQGLATEGFGADICGPESAHGLPYGLVQANGSDFYADENGAFNFVVPGSNVDVTARVEGLYFYVSDQAGAPIDTQTLNADGGPLAFVLNASNSDEYTRAQVNTYIQANVVRDYVLDQNPSYPVISGQAAPSNFEINVNINNDCNATYSGDAINFYRALGGCPNTGFSSVVYHEFGHHVVQSGGSGQGAYGEGMSDCTAVIVSDDSALAIGFFSDCDNSLRNADNDCQYSAAGCSSCGSESHACGNLISGCIWDLREIWAAEFPDSYRPMLSSIVVNSVPLHGPTSSINPDITIDFLTLDDDNGDIGDGTPHYEAIATAFGLHGMHAPQLMKFVYPNGLPSSISSLQPSSIEFEVAAILSDPQPGTGMLYWREGSNGPFTPAAMTELSPNHYAATIPAVACTSVVEFYLSAKTAADIVEFDPPLAPAVGAEFSTIAAADEGAAFADEMESDTGWTVGAPGDNASTGIWVRVDPNPTAAQPGDDHTEDGTMCWVTGQGSPGGALGENDVDGGVTTLLSPIFDATGADDVYVTYWRWYSNDAGNAPNSDAMPVQITNNNGASWTILENVTENANAWVHKAFRVSDYVQPTDQMRVRFQASDLGDGSLVEAGVDDFFVLTYFCDAENPADLDGNGSVDAADLSILLGAWGTSGPGDIDGNGIVDGADLSLLLGGWTL